MQKARILAVCTHPCFIQRCGRQLQRKISPQWQDLPHSFRTLMVLQPQSWQVRGISVAQLGVLAPPRTQDQKSSPEKFQMIYRFPGIRYCRALSRLKLVQTAITILVLPPIWYLYWQNQVTQPECLWSTGVACFATIMLYGMSFYLRRIIGMMYLNEDGTLLKVAHLTFWGRRKDIYCPVETVMTLGDMGEGKNEFLLRFQQYDNNQFLYFTLRLGQVVDREKFAKVFGGVQ